MGDLWCFVKQLLHSTWKLWLKAFAVIAASLAVIHVVLRLPLHKIARIVVSLIVMFVSIPFWSVPFYRATTLVFVEIFRKAMSPGALVRFDPVSSASLVGVIFTVTFAFSYAIQVMQLIANHLFPEKSGMVKAFVTVFSVLISIAIFVLLRSVGL